MTSARKVGVVDKDTGEDVRMGQRKLTLIVNGLPRILLVRIKKIQNWLNAT